MGETKHILKDMYTMSANVYSFSFEIICVKDSLTRFLFLYSFRNGTLFQLKRQNFNWKSYLGCHKDVFPLWDIHFCAIINVFTVTFQHNGSYLYIIS